MGVRGTHEVRASESEMETVSTLGESSNERGCSGRTRMTSIVFGNPRTLNPIYPYIIGFHVGQRKV